VGSGKRSREIARTLYTSIIRTLDSVQFGDLNYARQHQPQLALCQLRSAHAGRGARTSRLDLPALAQNRHQGTDGCPNAGLLARLRRGS
jgi:hypothetical protein